MIEKDKFYFYKSDKKPWLLLEEEIFKEQESYKFLYPVKDKEKEWMTLLRVIKTSVKEMEENKIEILDYYESVVSKEVYAPWKKGKLEGFQILKQIYDNALEKSLEAQN